MATGSSLRAEERRAQLLTLLDTDGSVNLEEVAVQLGVSAMTIRRDLVELEADGSVRRVRGGAIAADRPRSYDERAASESEAKLRIAAKAIELVPTTGVVAFDASSTVGHLITHLDDTHAITGASNSVQNYQALARTRTVSPVLIGGEPERETQSFVGPLAELTADALHTSHLFTSAAAVDAEWGTSEATLGEAAMKRVFRRNTDRTVLLATASKLHARSLARALRLNAITTLVTELDPSDPTLAPFRDLVEVR